MSIPSRNVLMVAYHYPPQKGSSGLLRTLKFSRYLLENGWKPTVLTVNPRAYELCDDSQLSDIPKEVEVIRAFAVDTKRHLSISGRYPRFAALPDRWVSWMVGAIPAGLQAIRRNKIDVIFTTYPIATSPLIGYYLHKFTGKPWVLDLRDPMMDDDHPTDAAVRKSYAKVESNAVANASCIIFTAAASRDIYLQRYPSLRPESCAVISNGFDEEDFTALQPRDTTKNSGPLDLLHAGLIYPHERNPQPFFEALSRLKKSGAISAQTLQIKLRSSGNEAEYARVLKALGIDDFVSLLPPIPYRESLQEAAHSAGLLLLQGPSCDHQIPAKAYEYLRIGRPILALASRSGATAGLLRECGVETIVNIDDSQEIEAALPVFLKSVRTQSHPLPDQNRVAVYSRKQQAQALAAILNGALEPPAAT
jgi:glycosyltransferase involved in cell wall biosynthesis